MDRHVEFVTQLSRLVSHYVHESDDLAEEKAALRAARAAAKHGAVSVAFDESVLRAGTHAVRVDEIAQLPALRDALVAAGILSVEVAHHARQSEIRMLALLLARVTRGELSRANFPSALHEQSWDDVRVSLAATSDEVAPDDAERAEPAGRAATPAPEVAP
ncbi:MAG: hypothetical protein ACYC3L_17015, partial [Gemmatimonadaceae bacterium]